MRDTSVYNQAGVCVAPCGAASLPCCVNCWNSLLYSPGELGDLPGMQLRSRNFGRGWSALLVVPVLSACAIIPGPVGSGSGNFAATNRMSFGNDPAPAVEAVSKVLVRRGYRITSDADFRIDVGLSKRPVEIGFRGEPGAADRGAAVEAMPEDRRLDLCREHTFRLSVAVTHRRSGVIAYRGNAEEVRCGEPDEGNLLGLANVALRSLQ